MTGLGIAVAIPAVVFYNLAVRINRSIMYHANDRAHDLLAQSAELAVTQQSLINNEPAVTQAQLVKGNHTETQAPQQTEHYHESAPSQP